MENKINNCGCGARGNHLSQNGYSIYCLNCSIETDKYPTMSEAIEAWNEAMPKLSNAQQAIQWLEQCKKIRVAHWNKDSYIYLDVDNVVRFHDHLSYRIFSEELFGRDWEVYTEPNYRYGNFKEAREAYKQGKTVSIEGSTDFKTWTGAKVFLTYVDDQGYLLKDLESGFCLGLFDKVLDSDKWKISD